MEAKTINTKRSITRVAIITGLILLLPLLAMQFNWQVPEPGESRNSSVNWSLSDFTIMGSLTMGVGLTYELAIKKIGDRKRRILFAVALILAFLLIWAELAVGVIGTPFAGS